MLKAAWFTRCELENAGLRCYSFCANDAGVERRGRTPSRHSGPLFTFIWSTFPADIRLDKILHYKWGLFSFLVSC